MFQLLTCHKHYYHTQPINKLIIICQLRHQNKLNNNYTLVSTQITDFNNVVKQLISNSSNNYLLNPSSQTTFNSNYQITDANVPSNTIDGSKIKQNFITFNQLQFGSVSQLTFDSNLQKYFSTLQYSSAQTDTYQTKTTSNPYPGLTLAYTSEPLGYFHTNQTYYNGSSKVNNYLNIGSSPFLLYSGTALDQQINYSINPTPSIQFNQNQRIYQISDNIGSVGMYAVCNSVVATVTCSSIGVTITGPIGPNQICCFSTSNTDFSRIAYISQNDDFNKSSDENVKNNIIEKTNYQEQLEKLLKLKIVTYSYGKNHQPRIDQIKQQLLSDQTLNDQLKQDLQNEIFGLQNIQAQTIQGYTYQDLEQCGFNYALPAKQIINNDLLQQQQIDQDKIKQQQQKNQEKAISESALITYIIMGIKALNEKIEQQSQRLDNDENA